MNWLGKKKSKARTEEIRKIGQWIFLIRVIYCAIIQENMTDINLRIITIVIIAGGTMLLLQRETIAVLEGEGLSTLKMPIFQVKV